ncbi:MAG TPA: hypothetical protein VN599_02920 [Rudaea sp.]|nr:hypothetical protein [Rudaea sp.]
MNPAHERLRYAHIARLFAPLALALLTGCAGLHTTPVPASEARAPVTPHKTAPEPKPTDQRTGLAAKEVGYYLDALQGRLLQKASGQIDIARQGDRIAVGIPNMKDPAQLQETLRSIAKVLIEYRFVRVAVDSAPAAGETASIADSRAYAAARALTRGGVTASRISAAGSTTPGAPAYIKLLLEPIVQSDGQAAGH